MNIRVLDIAYETMADGPGLRTSIYCAGCAHHCPGCHNPQSWDFHGGKEMTVQELLDIVKSDEFANVTFSGGDPLYQVEAFTELARRIKEETGKNYSEYLTERRMEEARDLLLNEEMTVSGVAEAVGYNSTRYFSRLFETKIGMKPNEYRRIYLRRNGR